MNRIRKQGQQDEAATQVGKGGTNRQGKSGAWNTPHAEMAPPVRPLEDAGFRLEMTGNVGMNDTPGERFDVVAPPEAAGKPLTRPAMSGANVGIGHMPSAGFDIVVPPAQTHAGASQRTKRGSGQ